MDKKKKKESTSRFLLLLLYELLKRVLFVFTIIIEHYILYV